VAETNEQATVVQRTAYTPYGASIGAQVDGVGYTGHVMDGSTGLTYMQQRYMDSDVGVFLSVDPVAASSNPIGMFNRYRYAANSPYRFLDPDGRQHADMSEAAAELGVHIRIALDQRAYRSMPPGPEKAAAARSLAISFSVHLNDDHAAQKLRLDADTFDGAPAGIVYRRVHPRTGETYIGRADDPGNYMKRQLSHDKSLGVNHIYEVIDRANPGKDLQVAEETQIRAHGGLGRNGGGLVNKRYEMREERYRAGGGRAPAPLGSKIRR
jgi:RHS repeat-associated protein